MSFRAWIVIWLVGLVSFICPWLSATGEALPVQERLVMGDQEIRYVLAKLGYLPSPGGHGPAVVEKAVIAFQTAEQLVPDGIVGVKTQAAMLIRFLESAVPEVAARRQKLGNRFVCYVENYPDISQQDPYRRNYYRIYTGTDVFTHVAAWNRFIIRKDFGEVLWNDRSASRDQYLSLERWRSRN